jgi:flagellar basal body-associated protein FliL
MSETKAEAADSSAPVDSGPKPSKLPLLLALLNTLTILAAVGALVYTRILFKRPKITEESERARIEAMKAAKPAKSVIPGIVVFDSTTINIASTPVHPKAADSTSTNPSQRLGGKLHYATVGFTLEVRDGSRKGEVEAIRPLITDQFLTIMGKKQFHELNSVQGRYVLKTQVIELANDLLVKHKGEFKIPPSGEKGKEGGEKEGGHEAKSEAAAEAPVESDSLDSDLPLVTNMYFTRFIVQ